MKNALLLVLFVFYAAFAAAGDELETGFRNPPQSARPWVFWF